MVDFLVKIVSMAIKCILVITIGGFETCISVIQKGRIYTVFELLVHCYRIVLPAGVWIRFFLSGRYHAAFTAAILVIYGVYKIAQMAERLYGIAKTIYRMFQTTPVRPICNFDKLVAIWSLCQHARIAIQQCR